MSVEVLPCLCSRVRVSTEEESNAHMEELRRDPSRRALHGGGRGLREKTVDFVDYFLAGTSFYTKASGGASISGLSDLCGHTVAAEKATTQETDATAQSAKCKSAGKPGVTVLTFPDQNGANLALSSGRAQLVMADSPPSEYAVKKSNGQFKITGSTYGTAPYGLA